MTETKIQHKKIKSMLNGVLYLLLLPISCYADVVDTLNSVLKHMTGDIGKVVATLAIVGAGYACFAMGRLNKSYFVSVVVGIAITFGASGLLSMLTGN